MHQKIYEGNKREREEKIDYRVYHNFKQASTPSLQDQIGNQYTITQIQRNDNTNLNQRNMIVITKVI